MMLVRFVEYDVDGAVVHDTSMPVAPRVGEEITLRLPSREKARYSVKVVDYLIDVKTGGVGVTEDLAAVRVVVWPV